MRCNAPDSFAGQALRTGSALLIEAGVQQSAGGIVASEQLALIADPQSSVGELMSNSHVYGRQSLLRSFVKHHRMDSGMMTLSVEFVQERAA